MSLDKLPQLDDDGLYLPVVGPWAETKYRLIANYAQMFATAMKGKWGARVYLDLFSAAGRARIGDTDRIVPTSATLALGVRDPFDKYVFCEIDGQCIEALELRTRRDFGERVVDYVGGDCNRSVERIRNAIPRPSHRRTVLTFCVVDPRKLADLKFETIRSLAELFVDFLVLIPSYMDAHRNLMSYSRPESSTLADFLGDPAWRERWEAEKIRGRDFGLFVVDRFGSAMRDLGFLYDGPGETVPVRDKHLLLYHLAFFSRNERGRDFWRKARRSSIDQLPLGF